MVTGITRLQALSEKTKHLKQELKYDIEEQDDKIDELLAKLGFEFVLAALQPNQKATVENLEAQVDKL